MKFVSELPVKNRPLYRPMIAGELRQTRVAVDFGRATAPIRHAAKKAFEDRERVIGDDDGQRTVAVIINILIMMASAERAISRICRSRA